VAAKSAVDKVGDEGRGKEAKFTAIPLTIRDTCYKI